MKLLVLQLFLIASLYALDTDNITNLVSQINNAPQSQKRKLINQLKLQLRNSNTQQRNLILNQLQKSHHTNYNIINQHIELQQHKTTITKTTQNHLMQQKGKNNH